MWSVHVEGAFRRFVCQLHAFGDYSDAGLVVVRALQSAREVGLEEAYPVALRPCRRGDVSRDSSKVAPGFWESAKLRMRPLKEARFAPPLGSALAAPTVSSEHHGWSEVAPGHVRLIADARRLEGSLLHIFGRREIWEEMKMTLLPHYDEEGAEESFMREEAVAKLGLQGVIQRNRADFLANGHFRLTARARGVVVTLDEHKHVHLNGADAHEFVSELPQLAQCALALNSAADSVTYYRIPGSRDRQQMKQWLSWNRFEFRRGPS